MISYLEMAQRYPVGAKVSVPVGGDVVGGDKNGKFAADGSFAGSSNSAADGKLTNSGNSAVRGIIESREVVGYEYCNGRGYLLFGNDGKMEAGEFCP